MARGWVEVGSRVYVRRYRFFDQNIVALLGRDETLIVDSRSTARQAAEIQADLRELAAPPVTVVVNSHGHSDHVFGNHTFRPCAIWGHVRCAAMVRATGERQRRVLASEVPELAAELAALVIDVPDRTFTESATVEFGGRSAELRYLGRGHTDNDIVLVAADADVVCAGDLLENGATPYFGDGYPLDWPATSAALLDLIGRRTVVIPGHGDQAGRAFVEESQRQFTELASLARRVQADELTLDEAVGVAPYPAESAREPLSRAIAQLRGELG
jgi:glyoxylase-like metal-dependent hydrolase (beta-lactamase superfamily II)